LESAAPVLRVGRLESSHHETGPSTHPVPDSWRNQGRWRIIPDGSYRR